MLRPSYPIRTPRLLLRPFEASDVDAVFAYHGREDVTRYVPFGPRTRSECASVVAERGGDAAALVSPPDFLQLAVVEASSGALIGDAILFWHSEEHRSGEIGYALHPDASGHGYATEAARALLELGFSELGLHRIVGRVHPDNTPSARVLERLGFRREAHHIEDEWIKGEWRSSLTYALLAREWRASGPTP